jgi:hypothetical protein
MAVRWWLVSGSGAGRVVVYIVLGLRRSRDRLGFVGAGYGQYVEEAFGMGAGLGAVHFRVCCPLLAFNRGVSLGHVDEWWRREDDHSGHQTGFRHGSADGRADHRRLACRLFMWGRLTIAGRELGGCYLGGC